MPLWAGEATSTVAVAVPLPKTPPPTLGPPGTSGRLHCERSPVSMSADQSTEPDGVTAALESALLGSFQPLNPKIFAAGSLPALLTRAAAIVTSTEANKAILNRRTKNLLLTMLGLEYEARGAASLGFSKSPPPPREMRTFPASGTSTRRPARVSA